MSEQKHINSFAKELRRVLYLSQLDTYNIEWLRDNPVTPTFMKNDIDNILKARNRMLKHMKEKAKGDTWDKIQMDMNKDQLHDVGLLIDELSDVDNVDEVLTIIKEGKDLRSAKVEA